jgi:hypothetical protein
MVGFHCTYEYAGGSQCQRLEHVRAAADAAVQEHGQPPLRLLDYLNLGAHSAVVVKTHKENLALKLTGKM